MINHPSITVYYKELKDIYSTISNADVSFKSIDNWISLVEHHAEIIGKKYQNADDRIKIQNDFKGDMLEILSEIFFKNSAFDDRFGLSNYTVSDSASDYGVDATGYNVNGHKCAVQCKYRVNPNPQGDDKLKYEDLAKTYFDGRENHNCDLDKDYTVFLFTTANEDSISHIIENNFKKKLVLVGRKRLSEIIHQNVNFWNLCLNEIDLYMSE